MSSQNAELRHLTEGVRQTAQLIGGHVQFVQHLQLAHFTAHV